MEQRDVILSAVFGTIGGLLVLVVLGLAIWFYLRAKKSKQRDKDFEGQNEHGDSSVDDRQGTLAAKKNGLLNLKTPLISTKSFG
ncbi:hypothetical protein ANTQUA_LOCUS4458 [Anthophora quadrimaculata]